MTRSLTDIDRMPRGGPDASCLDRRLETDCREYLDRDDVDDKVKRQVIKSLDWFGRVTGRHNAFAEVALELVADVPDPRILELGAGHGAVSRKLLEMHPTATVTVTDIDPVSVAAMAEGDLGGYRRSVVREMDATAIDAADGAFDLAVFAQSFHHLPPVTAAKVFAEGTRVATMLLIIDLPRLPSLLHVAQLAVTAPFAVFVPFMHDGFISSLRAYSPSALQALANHADPAIKLELPNRLFGSQVVIASR